jgi:lipopolysaccharide transport system permease protein
MKALVVAWRHRQVLWATTLSDIRGRFRGTLLGLTWALLYPVLFLGLYAVVYTMIFRIRVASFGTFEYVLLIFCGLVPFLGFSEALGTGVSSVTSNKSLIKNTLFPIELIPVKAVLASSVTMTVGLVMLMAVLWSNGHVYPAQLAIPLIVLLQLLFTIGLIWLLSAINVFISDLGQIVAILVLFLMLVSPIAYTHDMIPPSLLPFMAPNPLYYLIMLYRDAAFFGVVDVRLLGTFSLITAIMVQVGGVAFTRLKPLFADHV